MNKKNKSWEPDPREHGMIQMAFRYRSLVEGDYLSIAPTRLPVHLSTALKLSVHSRQAGGPYYTPPGFPETSWRELCDLAGRVLSEADSFDSCFERT